MKVFIIHRAGEWRFSTTPRTSLTTRPTTGPYTSAVLAEAAAKEDPAVRRQLDEGNPVTFIREGDPAEVNAAMRDGDVFTCPQFQTFRANLAAAGFEISPTWSGKTSRNQRFDNVCMFVIAGGSRRPLHSTFLAVDFGGNNGFGLYLDSLSNRLDIEEVVGPAPIVDEHAEDLGEGWTATFMQDGGCALTHQENRDAPVTRINLSAEQVKRLGIWIGNGTAEALRETMALPDREEEWSHAEGGPVTEGDGFAFRVNDADPYWLYDALSDERFATTATLQEANDAAHLGPSQYVRIVEIIARHSDTGEVMGQRTIHEPHIPGDIGAPAARTLSA